MSGETTANATPDIAIRARPPSPKRLSARVLIAGVCAAGAVIAFALVNGLAERPRRAQEREASSASASAPHTIAGASDQYAPETLAPPQMLFDPAEEEEALGPPRWSEEAPQTVNGQTPAAPAAPPLLFDLGEAQTNSRANVSQLTAPLSRYELKAGHVIHAALITALNSDAPGRVVAQVTHPVFDSVSGRHLLAPQGSRLLGTYESALRYGDDRLLFHWDRLILPDGSSLDLGAMAATDAHGAAGISDRVDNHLGRLTAAIGLSALISVVANEAEETGGEERALGPSLGDAAAQQAAQTGARIVERDLEVRPTLRVRAGASVRVLVTRDLILRPYRSERDR